MHNKKKRKGSYELYFEMSSDICTTMCDNFNDNFYLLSSY